MNATTGRPELTAWLLGAAAPLWDRGGVRFSGTVKMEEFHQLAELKARENLGAARYDALHATGSAHIDEQLSAVVPGGSSRLSVTLP